MIKSGNIVQITDVTHPWFPCLLIVGEVKSWGVNACALVPQSNDGSEQVSQAWNRLRFEQVEVVGSAKYLPE